VLEVKIPKKCTGIQNDRKILQRFFILRQSLALTQGWNMGYHTYIVDAVKRRDSFASWSA